MDNTKTIQDATKAVSASMLSYNKAKKSIVVSYLLWFFFGIFGAHRLYLKSPIIAIIMLICTLASYIFFPLFLITFLIIIFDLFYIPFVVKKINFSIMDSLDFTVEEKLDIVQNSLGNGVVIAIVALLALIVIGGILAALAIPRLTATRDDAYIAKALRELNMAYRDSKSYYENSLEFGTVSKMTNIEFDSEGDASLDEVSVNYFTGKEACVNFTYKPNGTLIISSLSTGASRVCKKVISHPYFKEIEGEHSFEEK